MMNIEQGISNYELDVKCSSSTRDFMAGAVTRPTACTQYGGLMHQFRHSRIRRRSARGGESTKKQESTGYPFDFAQGGESFDFAQDREPVERPVEPRISPAAGGLVRYDDWGRFQAFSTGRGQEGGKD